MKTLAEIFRVHNVLGSYQEPFESEVIGVKHATSAFSFKGWWQDRLKFVNLIHVGERII